MTFVKYGLTQAYKKVHGLGDRLALMKNAIDWESFRPIIKHIFHDDPELGGRPHTDEVVIARVLVLQALYNLSDQELEFQLNDRLSFRNFAGFPDNVPDFSTIWKIRERLQKNGSDRQLWDELQRQLNSKGYKVEKGVIQDASFIEADFGRKRYHKEKDAKKNGSVITYTPKQLSHIDKDGSFAVKAGQVHYGYKDHVKMDVDHGFIRDIFVTTASQHDATVNLVKRGDKVAYRDRGYFGTKVPPGVLDRTMQRATRAKKLNGGQQMRNRAISRIRAPGERPFAVIKCIFKGGCTFVKTLARVSVKEVFKGIAYNLYQLITAGRRAVGL